MRFIDHETDNKIFDIVAIGLILVGCVWLAYTLYNGFMKPYDANGFLQADANGLCEQALKEEVTNSYRWDNGFFDEKWVYKGKQSHPKYYLAGEYPAYKANMLQMKHSSGEYRYMDSICFLNKDKTEVKWVTLSFRSL